MIPRKRHIGRKFRTLVHDYDDDLSTVTRDGMAYMQGLLDQHGIPQDNPHKWFWLAYHLGRVDVNTAGITPVAPRPGAPKKWSKAKLLRLWADVEQRRLKSKGQTSVERIVARLAQTLGSPWHKQKPATLRNKHSEANQLVKSGLAGGPSDFKSRKAWVLVRYGRIPTILDRD